MKIEIGKPKAVEVRYRYPSPLGDVWIYENGGEWVLRLEGATSHLAVARSLRGARIQLLTLRRFGTVWTRRKCDGYLPQMWVLLAGGREYRVAPAGDSGWKTAIAFTAKTFATLEDAWAWHLKENAFAAEPQSMPVLWRATANGMIADHKGYKCGVVGSLDGFSARITTPGGDIVEVLSALKNPWKTMLGAIRTCEVKLAELLKLTPDAPKPESKDSPKAFLDWKYNRLTGGLTASRDGHICDARQAAKGGFDASIILPNGSRIEVVTPGRRNWNTMASAVEAIELDLAALLRKP